MTAPQSSPTPPRDRASSREPTFMDRVASLTHAATAPPVIGETRAWCSRIANQLRTLAERNGRRRDRHDDLREDLAAERPVQGDRLDDLGEREQALGRELTNLRARAEALARDGEGPGVDEPYQRARALREDLLAWCVAARALDGELRSRVMETHYRDRGTVD